MAVQANRALRETHGLNVCPPGNGSRRAFSSVQHRGGGDASPVANLGGWTVGSCLGALRVSSVTTGASSQSRWATKAPPLLRTARSRPPPEARHLAFRVTLLRRIAKERPANSRAIAPVDPARSWRRPCSRGTQIGPTDGRGASMTSDQEARGNPADRRLGVFHRDSAAEQLDMSAQDSLATAPG